MEYSLGTTFAAVLRCTSPRTLPYVCRVRVRVGICVCVRVGLGFGLGLRPRLWGLWATATARLAWCVLGPGVDHWRRLWKVGGKRREAGCSDLEMAEDGWVMRCL